MPIMPVMPPTLAGMPRIPRYGDVYRTHNVDMDSKIDVTRPRRIRVAADEVQPAPVLTREQRNELAHIYDNRTKDSRVLIREPQYMPGLKDLPSLQSCSEFMSPAVQAHLRHTHPSLHMNDGYKSKVKRMRFPPGTADVTRFTPQQYEEMAHVDPAVRPLVEFFHADRGYAIDNRCPLSIRRHPLFKGTR